MDYLYHGVPKNMSGTILYPLNKLKDIYPEVYSKEVGKYKGREILLSTKIPPLNCLWNDVLHFTAVTPEELKNNLEKGEIHYKQISFFKIPVSMIVGTNSVALTYKSGLKSTQNLREYKTFDPSKMEFYRKMPQKTIEYYKQKKIEGVAPLLYHRVPHILYKGDINTKNLEIVTV